MAENYIIKKMLKEGIPSVIAGFQGALHLNTDTVNKS